MRVLVLLQNAWQNSAEPGQTQWLSDVDSEVSHRYWEQAMWCSSTGRNLRDMLPQGEYELRVGNASPFIGSAARSRFPMDPAHVCSQLAAFMPDVVVLLGSEARKSRPYVEEFGASVIEGFHPTARAATRADKEDVRHQLEVFLSKGVAKV